MKPSSLSTPATLALRREAGMSTAGRSMRLALRMRVSMSAKASVIIGAASSPARLLDPGDQAVARHVGETDPANPELAVDGAGPAAQPAAQADADLVARPHLLGLVRGAPQGLHLGHLLAEPGSLRFGGHEYCLSGLAERHAEGTQQFAGL